MAAVMCPRLVPAWHPRLTDICLAATSDVRNWLGEIGLSQYADQLIAKGLDDLQDLQQEVDLKELKIRLRKDGTMLAFHLEKLIRKLEAFRTKPSMELPPSTPVAASSFPVATLLVQPVASASAASAVATLSSPVVTSIYPVDYSQVSA